jgi:SAM-dependent methyltransferase
VKIIDRVHERGILPRRAVRLATLLAGLIPQQASVLDVGSGDGRIDQMLLEKRPDIKIQGVEVPSRAQLAFPVTYFDGQTLPFENGSFEVVMFVDVLHHTDDPMILLREATRVARKSIILKDHLLKGFLAGVRLRFMDYVGNARHGVALPFNYWSEQRWADAERVLGLNNRMKVRKLDLYPWPADWVFGASLHFIACYDLPTDSAVERV